MTDKIKLVLSILLLLGGVVAYYSLASYPQVVRVLAVLAGFGAAAGMAWATEMGKQFFAFGRDSWAEAKRVTWPSRKESLQTTGVVVVLVIVMALFLWMVDASLLWAVKLLMGRGA